MDIRIGVTDNPREINLDLAADTNREEVKASVRAAVDGSSDALWFTDDKGREVVVPSSRIAYVEIGPDGDNNPIGFG